VQISDQTLSSCIYHYAKYHCLIAKKEEVDIEPLLEKILNLLKTLTVREEDLCACKESSELPSIFNVLNGQISVDPVTGEYDYTEGHDPESRQTSVIQASYDPFAICLEYHHFMYDCFDKMTAHNRVETIRHLEELAGYSMQSNKDIAAIVMLHGSGANGKSVFLKIMAQLLAGDSSVWMSVGELENDNFAKAGLVGKNIFVDQDMNSKDIMLDGALKKLSENAPFFVRQIYKASQTVNMHVTPWLACNNFNRLPDPSDGFGRRFHAIPFHSRVADEDQDSRLLVKLKTETSGMLNVFLEGFKRLRQRGKFKPSQPCIELKQQWLQSANPIHAFLAECTVRNPAGKVSASELYKAYLAYCAENSTKHAITKLALIDALYATAIYDIDMNDRSTISGMSMKGPETFRPARILIDEKSLN
jgi:P4 family phage/plasmid primase-like protien